MKAIILTMILGSTAYAAQPAKPQYGKVAPTMTKLDAVRTLIQDPKAIIYKCSQVEMNDKMSLVNVKSAKK